MTERVEAALAYARDHFRDTVEALKDAARIPGVSADPPPNPALKKSAEHMAAWMKRVGLEGVEVIELEGAHPYVYGERLRAKGAPTIVIYAHHDVQPPGRPEYWKSPAFEPTERDGRLYGRGVVDDKAGAAIHLAAIDAYERSGGLPINVKVVIDGEEEIGSESLERFLERYKERLAADVIVLTDTANLATGVPSITYALRGIVVVDVEVTAIDHPLHSGMWGGPVPDSAMALNKMLAKLVADDGSIAVEGLYDDVRPITEHERERLRALPFDEAGFRADAGIHAGVAFAGERGLTPYEKIWRRPSITVQAMESHPIKGSSNQIVASARARIGVRTVPDMDGAKVGALLCTQLEKNAPWGVKVAAKVNSVGGHWMTTPEGPAFDAAARALAKGYGRATTFIGCGGSIPFVEPFARVLGGVPALLLGLEDPICNAHSENESLSLDDFAKAIAGAVHLYDEIARLPRAAKG